MAKNMLNEILEIVQFSHLSTPPRPNPQIALADLDTSSTRRSRFDLGRAELEKRRSWEWEWIMPFLWLSKKGGFGQFYRARILLGTFFNALFSWILCSIPGKMLQKTCKNRCFYNQEFVLINFQNARFWQFLAQFQAKPMRRRHFLDFLT